MGRLLSAGQKLQRAYTIAADLVQKTECIGSVRADALGDHSSDSVVVGQQVVEVRRNHVAAVAFLPQRQGQRHGNRAPFIGEPFSSVGERNRTAGGSLQYTDAPPVQGDLESASLAPPRHQNKSAISSCEPLLRG